ncbi:hypothetical protein PLEOSDRAFT_1045510 [Pleurotus ostreatus PC15]|uniref:Methyltransferase domain-containing protein n=1 Tax=Pleurotus ostreatus (strain PC15) TaxID=1137138 RepID=A0A067NEI5_PLEO1|nr:hypothetical protein PLEOSDRAFT_1045510 [Pleurotus ostreatus PC15]
MSRFRGERVSSSGNISSSMRDNYGEYGYYRRVGATYKNPHFPGVKACTFHWMNKWYEHEGNQPDADAKLMSPLVFDMACGSGEVTISVLKWWHIGKLQSTSPNINSSGSQLPSGQVQPRRKGIVPPSLPADAHPPVILAADPYTSEAYRLRTSRLCSSLSFREIAEGAVPPIAAASNEISSPSPVTTTDAEPHSSAVEKRPIDMVFCSFALHLIEDPSELFALLWELSTKSKWLIVIAPHKKPEIKEGWGWTKWDPVKWAPCQMLDQQNDILHESRVHCRIFRSHNA